MQVSAENRKNLIVESRETFLKLKFSETLNGEFKVINQKKDETLVGLVRSDCDQSDIQFWQVKKGVWKDVTKNVIEPLGKKDVIAILEASPAEIEDLSQKIEIPFFYTFDTDSNNLRLIARKQSSCEIAATVYLYTFNGKKYVKNKK